MNPALTDLGSSRGGVLVTGPSTGISRASALSLDALGFWVFASVRKSGDGESLWQAGSSRLTPIFLEVADEQSIVMAAENVSQEVGDAGLVGLVNNAGVAIPGPLEYLPLADLRRQLEINLVGQLAVTQAFLPLLRKARGRIVNISSLAGKMTTPFNGAYSAAKHGIEAFSDALRLELAPWAIHVCVAEPGTIATSMPESFYAMRSRSLAPCRPKGENATDRPSKPTRRGWPHARKTAAPRRSSPRRSFMPSPHQLLGLDTPLERMLDAC